jgi:DNA replication protein DnaC
MLARDATPVLKLNDKQRRDLVDIVEDRYEWRSTIITSRIPLGHWFDMISNTTTADAILDGLVHNAYHIELSGESLRTQCAVPMSDTTVA